MIDEDVVCIIRNMKISEQQEVLTGFSPTTLQNQLDMCCGVSFIFKSGAGFTGNDSIILLDNSEYYSTVEHPIKAQKWVWSYNSNTTFDLGEIIYLKGSKEFDEAAELMLTVVKIHCI